MDSDLEWESRIRAALEAETFMPEDEVVEELAGHAQAMYAAARGSGCTDEEANGRVNHEIEFWRLNVDSLRRPSRRQPAVKPPPAFCSSFLSGLARDISYAARRLWREPRYALLTIMIMALVIGAMTVLFSITYGVLIKPLPWPHGNRLVVLKEMRGGHTPRFGSFTNATYLAWRDQMRNIEDIAAWWSQDMTLAGLGEPERIRVVSATASLFRVLGVRTIIGSAFSENDETKRVLVLSQSLWRERFNASPHAIGSAVLLNGQQYTVIGILNDAVAYPDQRTRAWIPMRIHPATGNYLSMYDVVAAARPGATPADISTEGTARGRFAVDSGMTAMAIFGGSGPIKISAEFLRNVLTADVRQPLVVLLVAVGLLFAVATANIASVQLARATMRRHEVAIRSALGAGTARIGRQFVVESLLPGFSGGIAGLMFALWFHRLMPSLLPADFPRIGDLSVSTSVVLFALFSSVAANAICGVVATLYVCRLRIPDSLSENGSAVVGSDKRSPNVRARMVIMAAQVSLSCILLVGGSLLTRSFVGLINVDRGYNPAAILTARLSLPEPLYTPERRYSILDDVLHRLRGEPGITFASFTSESPLTPGGSTAALTMKARQGGIIVVQASPRIVSPQYFSALGMRIVQGRSFADSDTETALPVAIVNRSFSRRYLDDAALGATLPMGVGYQNPGTEATIVGVVDDVRYMSSAESTHPEIYYSYLQMHRRVLPPVPTLMIRTSGNPEDFVSTLREAVHGADAGLAPDGISTMEKKILGYLARARLYAIVLSGFAAFSVIVAGVGLFGVLSYIVAQRSREIALRMALGAQKLDIMGQVLRQGLTVALIGLSAGMVVSFALAHLMAAMLNGVTPNDAVTYLAVPVVLISVALAACFAPALRAARVDPIRLLKG